MRLEKEFTVAAPLERAWEELLDSADFAGCLPDAELHALQGALYERRLSLDLHGSGVKCVGVVRLVDADEDNHSATIRIHGHEAGGPAIGRGVIESRLMPADGSTRVALSAQLRLTGQRASAEQVEEVGRTLLDGFAKRLEQRMLERAWHPEVPEEPLAPERELPPREAPSAVAEPEMAGAAPALTLLREHGLLLGAIALVVAVVLAASGRRRSVSLAITYRW